MKILILGHSYFLSKLSREHEIVTVGFYNYHNIKLSKAVYKIDYILSIIPWRPNIIFLGDDSFPITYVGIEELEIPTIIYAVDSHIHPWQLYYAHTFDIALFAQKFFYEVNFDYQIVKKWFPLYCNPERDKKMNADKIYDVSFVGTLNPELNKPRVELINGIKKKIKNFFLKQGDFVEIFNKSKIVLNQIVNNDINFRFFEALGCGAFLLSERVVGNGFKELFSEGEHLECFEKGNIEDAVTKINYFLKNYEEALIIAEKGYNLVREKHTIFNRLNEFLYLINSLNLDEIVNKRMKNLKEIKFFLKMAYIAAADSYKQDKKLSELYLSLASKI